MNKLFYETLKKNSTLPFELIIIDNNSTDGSLEFFRTVTDKVIANTDNYSYPYCQNQGIRVAKYDYLAFFNNDMLVCDRWDVRILDIMKHQDIEVISFATNEFLENKKAQRNIQRKWKRVKYSLRAIFGINYKVLKWMIKLTYGNFDAYCSKRYKEFGETVREGFTGACIMVSRSGLAKVGEWDERIQAADFDIFCRTKQRSLEKGDIKPLQVALGIYFHHFQRLTLQSANLPVFKDKANLITMDEKWGERVGVLMKDIKS
jgi:glycosyltransferase involved in cell wall biosynthesis